MIFELMSKGNLAQLPDEMCVVGLPETPSPRVLLLLPYNRYLLGTVSLKTYEHWRLGKLGSEESEELFLYEDKPKTITLGEVETITIAKEVVDRLKSCLRNQMPPPGEHLPAMLILRGLLKEDALFQDEDYLKNENAMQESLDKDAPARMAYWAIRFALSRNDYEGVSRIKTWLKIAPDVFEGTLQTPRIWFSLMDLPGRKDIEDMESLAFSVDDLQRMNSQSSRPVVLYSKAGYLILSDFGSDDAAFRIWLYLPIPLWNEMREKRKLSIREIVMATWGYLDGLAADTERSSFGLLASMTGGIGIGKATQGLS